MRILLIVASLARKGPILVARDIAQVLVEGGHTVVVYYLDDKIELDFPCPTSRINRNFFRDIQNADIVHSHSLRPDAIAWLLRKISSKAKFISTIHNYVEQDLSFAYGPMISRIFSFIWRRMWGGLDACVVLTRDSLNYYIKTQPTLQLHVVYNARPEHIPLPISKDDEIAIQELRSRFRIIGASAVVMRRKGFDQIIRALPFLPHYAFLLIGDGTDLTELKELASELGVADRFLSLGFRGNARDYLAYMDLFAMPSHSEGMPLAMLEAASSGVPIICSDIPVFHELFDSDEVDFFLLDNVESFINAIHRAEKSSIERAEAAKIRFSKSYSMKAMADGYEKCYRSLIDAHTMKKA